MFKGGEAASSSLLPDVRFALPAPVLRPLITTYYHVIAHGPLEDYLHPEWGNIRFTLDGQWQVNRPGCADPTPRDCALFGPSDRTAIVSSPGQSAMAGVGLTNLGWLQLVGKPASVHANRCCNLRDIYGDRATALVGRLRGAAWPAMVDGLDEFFSGRLASAPPPDPVLASIEEALLTGDISSVADLADRLGLTERTLARHCLRLFGFTPKRLLRRQRFLRTLAEIGDRLDQPLSVLLDGSYFDQSHFIREFRSFMGMTPLAYFHSPRQMMRRAAAERMRAAGTMAQGLHQPG